MNTTSDLFGHVDEPTAVDPDRTAELGQYMTPSFLAELIVERHFADLPDGALVIEPTCGDGAFLRALPKRLDAIGIEVDPAKVIASRRYTDRKVLLGDFRQHLPRLRPDAIVGNPPFETRVIDELLDISHEVLAAGGRMGLILPAYVFQTAGRVVRYSRSWSLAVEMLPRNVFPGLHCPLSFAMFTKDQRRLMIGLSFYEEAEEFLSMPERFREKLRASRGVWATVVEDALEELGGRASLDQLYQHVAPRRPTPNEHWKASIRKVARQFFVPVGQAEYALPQAA